MTRSWVSTMLIPIYSVICTTELHSMNKPNHTNMCAVDISIILDTIAARIGVSTVPTFNSCTKCMCISGIIHDRTTDYHPVPWAWMNSQLNVALISKLRGQLICLAYFFDMLSMVVCTIRHWETSGRLVQELNACTVAVLIMYPCFLSEKCPLFLLKLTLD